MSGGGSGSAGGGSAGSGEVSYPDYMESQHQSWLTQVNGTMSIAKGGGSPFLGINPYNPDANLETMDDAGATFLADLLSMSFCDDWRSMVGCAVAKIDADIVDEATADANINAFGDLIDDQITAEVLPRFEAGMVDINSVISSAFVIGRALIEDGRDKAVVKYGTDLKLQNYKQRNEMIMTSVEVMKVLFLQRLEFHRTYVALIVEIQRISIVARVENANQEADFADRDARWDLEVYQYGTNVLAGIAGGTVSPERVGPNQGMSALGGALSGAAAGAMVGTQINPGWGTAIGAVAGGALGYLGSQ